jgi:hypothetical protein
MTTLREKLIKIGAKVVTHARYVTFQMAEVAISRQLFKLTFPIWTPVTTTGRAFCEYRGGR